jgi:thiaminase
MLHEILWQQNVRLAEACLHHPFVRRLADGTLEPEAFRRYVAQDGSFLTRSLGLMRLPPPAARARRHSSRSANC